MKTTKRVSARAKQVLAKVEKLPVARTISKKLRRRAGAAVDRVIEAIPLPVDAAVAKATGEQNVERKVVATQPPTLREVKKPKTTATGQRRTPSRAAAKQARAPKPAGPKTKRGQKHR